LRVLYVNHTGEVSGAERSLLTLLDALRGDVDVHVAAPPGPLDALLAERGLAATPITGTAGSLKLHPRHTPRAVYELGRAGEQVRRLARRLDADVVHANSIRAGIACAAVGSTPVLTHVRDCLPSGAATTATMRLIAARSRLLVANSRYTAASVLAAAPNAAVEVAYNPVDVVRFDPARVDRTAERARFGAGPQEPFLLGVVAQLTPWKGQRTAIEALAALHRRGIPARLLLAGSAKFTARATRFDNAAYEQQLRACAASLGVGDDVVFLGEVQDVPGLVGALDALALPSTEEPFGRAVIEAMAMGVPVLATAVGGPAEIVREGVDGYLLDPGDPAAWADAAATLAREPQRRAALGAAGRASVLERFTPEHHAAAIMDMYSRVTA
jgi:glycosyltransferase involved in cell wall biosynthesis